MELRDRIYISVVIPAYNCTESLHKSLACVIHQTLEHKYYEIIIVDDASTDNGQTWEMILAYERKYPDLIVSLQSEVNRRQGGARNLGISRARGDYIAFLDDDDFYLPHTLGFALEAALHYQADLVEFDTYREINGEKLTDTTKPDEIVTSFYDIDTKEKRKEFILQPNIGNCWNKLYKASVIRHNKIRFCENCFYEEPSFIYPFKLCTNRYCKIWHILYIHVEHKNSTLKTLMSNDSSKYDNMNAWGQSFYWFKSSNHFAKYHDEIEFLFIDWFLVNSIFFIIINLNQKIEEIVLSHLQNYMHEKFPDYEKNPYAAGNELLYLCMHPLKEQGITIDKFNEIIAGLRNSAIKQSHGN